MSTGPDYEIEKAIYEAWKPHKGGMALDTVYANVKDGHVTITGNTNTLHIEQDLINLAQSVPGVKSVKSELHVSQGGE